MATSSVKLRFLNYTADKFYLDLKTVFFLGRLETKKIFQYKKMAKKSQRIIHDI